MEREMIKETYDKEKQKNGLRAKRMAEVWKKWSKTEGGIKTGVGGGGEEGE